MPTFSNSALKLNIVSSSYQTSCFFFSEEASQDTVANSSFGLTGVASFLACRLKVVVETSLFNFSVLFSFSHHHVLGCWFMSELSRSSH